MSLSQFLRKKDDLIIALIVFSTVAIFFGVMHPIPMNSPDDWSYMSDNRVALPIWGGWNPAKVLPEVLAPICGSISAFVVAPIIGDYVSSFSVTIGALMSLLIAVYCTLFYKICKEKLGCSVGQSLLLTILFLILHFAMFRSKDRDNPYLFYAWDLNCYYNYVIPNVLNTIMVMYCIESGILAHSSKLNYSLRSSLFVLICYLSLASNLFGSIIFASYLFLELIKNFYNYRKDSESNLKTFIIKNAIVVALLSFWAIVQLFELFGARSAELEKQAMHLSFVSLLSSSFDFWISAARSMNRWVCILLVTSFFTGAFLMWKQRSNQSTNLFLRLISTWLVMSILVHIYCILVCSKVKPYYIARPEVMAAGYYCVILMMLTQIAFIIRNIKFTFYLFPIVILFYYTQANSDFNTYKETTGMSFLNTYLLNNEAYHLLQEIDSKGQTNVDLQVPLLMQTSPDYWNSITRTLYKHGQTNSLIHINSVCSCDVNSAYWTVSPQ